MHTRFWARRLLVRLLLFSLLMSGAPRPAQAAETPDAINNLNDVQKAVIQIESAGVFADPQQGLQAQTGRGSGFIIDPSGIAVTNNHVVTGAAILKVYVNGETTPHTAHVLGVSECADLAVIQIEGNHFPYLPWSTKLPKVNMKVYAAGFPLGEPEYDLEDGIINKERTKGDTYWASVDHIIKHSATIKPGNSGGLCSMQTVGCLASIMPAISSIENFLPLPPTLLGR